MTELERIEPLRTIPHLWLSINATSRTPGGELAWTVTCKYGATAVRNVQYSSTSLSEALDNLFTHLTKAGVLQPPKPKLKLKRSNT